MSTKAVSKIFIDPSDISQIADGYIESKVKEVFSDVSSVINIPPGLAPQNKERYLFFPEKKLYYDKATGYLFPSIHGKSQAIKNKIVLEREQVETIFGNLYFSQEGKGKIIYVNCEKTNTGSDGTSWDLAFPKFDSAVATARPNDQIWVAKGDYHGNFELPEGIAIYGGFEGWEDECWLRDSEVNITTFKGDNKAGTVFIIKNTQKPITICGVTIINAYGRALVLNKANVTISQCQLVYTQCDFLGGAIYSVNSQLIVSDCLFANNQSSQDAATHILYSEKSQSYFLNSQFNSNRTRVMWIKDFPATAVDCVYLYKGNNKEIKDMLSGGSVNISNKSDLPADIYAQVYSKEVIAKQLVKDPNNNYEILQSLIAEGLLSLNKANFEDDNELKKIGKYLINRDSKACFDLEKVVTDLQTKKLTLNSSKLLIDKVSFIDEVASNKAKLKITQESVHELLLNCEKRRANITPYDSKILTDINQGHWDLWSDEPDNKIELELKDKLIARDPKSSVKENNIVAIDFGTKSTVVVYYDENNITLPIRIGDGDIFKELNQRQYENPTVIEFINLTSFKSDYQAKAGRPNTQWEDITVSHTAFNNLLNNSSDLFYSVLADLKQWAGDSYRKILLKDKNNSGKLIELPEFVNLTEKDLNPIEIYAYYIGLFINNMHRGINLSYLLSFPVTYEKGVREKIRQSFYNGIKKTLPESLVNNEKFMQSFTVSIGASEPAAYAVCALKEYGFKPEGEEKDFYAIFDFGGGTTDFDFGVWQGSEQDLLFDFEIEHFGSKGDKYLGGENLLELLAFEIFKDNLAELKKNKISFTLPPEQKEFPGCEAVLKTSQEAKMNMKQVIETIRPFWESRESFEHLDAGQLNINLISNEGKLLQNSTLRFDLEKLDKILTDRIERGVIDFFESLRLAFERPGLESIDKINIFLAGNSSKSPIVTALFDKYINELTEDILKNKQNKELFELFPPLGTDLATEKLKERGIEVDEDQSIETRLTKPTGKTGVAFGLIESREGGRVKVINHNFEVGDEVKFQYFIGINKRNRFKPIIDSNIDYHKWHEFTPAGKAVIDFHYTPSANATTNKLAIGETKRVSANIDEVDSDKTLYVRAIKSNVIQYTVASKDEISTRDNKEDRIKELVLEF